MLMGSQETWLVTIRNAIYLLIITINIRWGKKKVGK